MPTGGVRPARIVRGTTCGPTPPARWAYPMVLLLASTLAVGCGAPPRTDTGDPARTPATSPSGSTSPSGNPSPQATATVAKTAPRYAFPVGGRSSYHPTHSAYPATDIFAACGNPVLAVTDGRILEVSRVDRFDKSGTPGPDNGGRFVSLLGDDGVRYYGSHLTQVLDGIEAGVRVRAGQQVGRVGRTGNANNVCHLHFGISPPCRGTGDWWIRRGVVWPAPFLDAWRKKTGKAPAGQVGAWHRRHGCPTAP